MEKRVWTKPLAVAETFTPNEYIAGCDDLINEYYAFVCNGGGGAYGGVWVESNGVSGLQEDGDTRISRSESSYHACGTTHYALKSAAEFEDGYYKEYSMLPWVSNDPISVIVWRGPNGDNVHTYANANTIVEVVKGNKS